MQRIRRELTWLKEDLLELRERIPSKYFDMAANAVVFMGYFFIFEAEARQRPALTVVGCLVGSWIGVEAILLLAKAIKKVRR